MIQNWNYGEGLLFQFCNNINNILSTRPGSYLSAAATIMPATEITSFFLNAQNGDNQPQSQHRRY
jgi:hypothetical protein